jgi:hypothetical protein
MLDLSKFSGLTELEINNCPIITSIKFPASDCQLNEITINNCKNLRGDIDLSACANIEYANIIGAGRVRIIVSPGSTFSGLYIGDCQNPEVIVTENNSELKVEFKNCEFSQDDLIKMQTLKDRCQVTGLPQPPPTPTPGATPIIPPAAGSSASDSPPVGKIRVFVPKAVPRQRIQAADVAKPTVVERAVPVGISNTGASCYAASLLQLLFQNQQFREALAELCAKIPQDTAHQKLAHVLNKIFAHLQSGSGACPQELMREFLQLEKDLGYANAFSQDDPTLLRRDIMTNLAQLFHRGQLEDIAALRAKLLPTFHTHKAVKPLIQDGSYTMSYYSRQFDVDGGAIEVPPNAGSLEAALSEQFGSRKLTGENQHVDKSGRHDALETTKISENLPEALAFDVRRVNIVDGKVQKLTDLFAFQQHIDMRKYMTDPNGPPRMYELNSVVAHSGGAGGGHYISYVKREGKWFQCNDSSVKEVAWSDVQKVFGGGSFHATMLLYGPVRRNSVPE